MTSNISNGKRIIFNTSAATATLGLGFDENRCFKATGADLGARLLPTAIAKYFYSKSTIVNVRLQPHGDVSSPLHCENWTQILLVVQTPWPL